MAPRLLPALALALLAACPHRGPAPRTGAGPEVALVLPALDGGEVDLHAYRGHVVAVQFFTTWSLDAQEDVAELRALRAAHPDLIVVGIGMDPDGYALIAPWRDAVGIDWMIGLPTPELAAGATPFGQVPVVPTVFLLDRQGRIAYRHDGPLPRGEIGRVAAGLEAGGRRP
jgi:hypothetical protein